MQLQLPAMTMNNQQSIHIPVCIIVEHVMPFIDDRLTWNNCSMACRYSRESSKHIIERPWPSRLSLPKGSHHSIISTIAFSSDGRYLACGSISQIDIWDRIHGHVVQLRHHHLHNPQACKGRIKDIVFSHDDRYIGVCSTDSNPIVWDLTTKEIFPLPLFESAGHRAKRLSFCNDNNRIICASSHGIWNCDYKSGQCRQLFSMGIARWYAHLLSIETTNVGQWLATSEDHAGVVKFVNMNDHGKSMVVRHNADYITDVAFSQSFVATGGDHGIVQIWDRRHGGLVDRLYGLASNVTSIAFHPDDGVALAGADDSGRINISSQNGEFCTLLGSSKSISKVAFTPDGSMLVSAGNELCFWTRAFWEGRSLNE